MAEIDYITLILPVLLSSIVTFIAIAVTRGLKMGSNTISGTVKIEGLQEELADLKKTVRDGTKEMERSLEKNEQEFKAEWSRVWTRIEALSSNVNLHEYRLNELQNRKQPGDKSAI